MLDARACGPPQPSQQPSLSPPSGSPAPEPAPPTTTTAPPTAAVQPANVDAIPDGFDPRQRLGDEEYAEKAEGGYFTGLPLINYDSNTGLGFGARGYYFFDGERSDPRFAYTSYLYRVFLQAFATAGGYQFTGWISMRATCSNRRSRSEAR